MARKVRGGGGTGRRPWLRLEALESRVLLSTTDPVIFNWTESAKPGEVISLQGENFGGHPEVWVDQIANGADAPNPEVKLTNVLSAGNQLVTAELPTSLAAGLYAVFVKNTDTGVTGAYKWVNQTRALQYLDLADTAVRPGQAFRIDGRNLDFAGATTTVQFRDVSTGVVLNATVTQGTDSYIVSVVSPSGLVTGDTYDVLVSNGYGGSYSQTTGPQLKAKAAGTDYWGLGTTWATDYTFSTNVYNIKTDARLAIKAVGDGVTDDSAAIQGAINAANAAGGGVVYLPAGTYNVSGHTFGMKSNVILQGAGMNASRILDDGGLISGTPLFSGGPSKIGVVDLTIECTANGNNSTWKVGGSAALEQFLLRSRFINNRKEVLVYGSHLMVVDGCEIIHKPLNGKNVIDFSNRQNFIIRNSYIQWSDGRVDILSNAKNIQLENNTWSRSIYTDGANLGYGGPSVGTAVNVAILNNTFNKVAGEPGTQIPKNNDGETLMNENIEYAGTGTVTGATNTTLTAAAAWTVNGKTGWEVTIVQGKGMGQTRKITSNTADTLTVDSAWDVNPDATSYYAITKFDDNYLVKGNTLQDVPRGIWVTYGGSMRDVAIVGNHLIDGQGIYLRGDTRSGGRFNVQKNIVVEGNDLQNTKNWYPAQIVVSQVYVSGTELIGNPFYNVIVRGNSITAPIGGGLTNDDGSGCGDGYYARQHNLSDDNTAGVFGVVFDHNTATNLPAAYSVNSGSYNTVIFNSVNNNVAKIVSDGTMSGDTHASVGTVVAWTSGETALPYAGVTATDANAAETGADGGNFRISRSGTTGDLTVNYVISGGASSADYTQTLTGSVVIPAGQAYVDLPITPVDDTVYYEGNEALTLTIAGNAAYQVGSSAATVTIADNDNSYNVLTAGFSGSGTGSGSGAIMNFGGSATLSQGGTGNTATIETSPTMNGGFLRLADTTTGANGKITITPTSADGSWAALATKPGSQWLINGAFDFFTRANGSSIGAREMDFSNTGGGGWRITLFHSSTNMRMEWLPPSGAASGSSMGGIGYFGATMVTGQVYHMAITFNTDPNTGVVTYRYFEKAGTGAIDTSSTSADRIYSNTFNPDEAVVTGKPSSGSFTFGDQNAGVAGKSTDFDTIRLWVADPGILPGIDSDAAVNVAATGAAPSETGPAAGVFTVSRNGTVGNVTVQYTLGGTAVTGMDYTVSGTMGSVVIPSGQSSATVTITPVNDALAEGDETVTLTITPDAKYTLGVQAATVTIADNDVVVDSTPPLVQSPGATTTDSTPEISGTVDDPLASVVVNVGGQAYTAEVNGGTWVLADNTLPPMKVGDYPVTVEATDAAGNKGTATLGLTILPPVTDFVGTPGNDEYAVRVGDDGQFVEVWQGPETGSPSMYLDRDYVQTLSFTLGDGNDTVTMDGINGAPVGDYGLSLDAGLGSNTLTLAGGTYFFGSSFFNVPGDLQLNIRPGTNVTFGDPPPTTPTVGMTLNGVVAMYALVAAEPPAPVLPVVSVAATDARASESQRDPGTFTISRDGTVGDLRVFFALGGTAEAGDYAASATSSVVIPDGQSSVTVTITPVDDALTELPETVNLALVGDAAYQVGTSSAAATIADNDTWLHSDIGSVKKAGSITGNAGTYTVVGGGAGISGKSDAFQFAYQTLTGDGTIVARVAAITGGGTARAGIMIRSSLAANAPYVGLFVTKGESMTFQRRTATGGATVSTSINKLAAPQWVKLVRSGSVITAYRSSDGAQWTLVGSQSVAMGSTVYVGMAVSSFNNNATATGVFDGLSLG